MIDSTIERIKAGVPALKLVGGAADFQTAADTAPKAAPAAFVMPLEEIPGPCETTALVQHVQASIGVVTVVRNVSDDKGVAARQDLDLLRGSEKELLLGWVPADGCDPFERGPGRLMAFKNGYMWWMDIYKTAYYDRSVL